MIEERDEEKSFEAKPKEAQKKAKEYAKEVCEKFAQKENKLKDSEESIKATLLSQIRLEDDLS